ncbi:hypothetical protein ACHQM5_006231 [Ranunculus cassubicifolius]
MSSPSFSITVACRPECANLLHANPASVAATFTLNLNKMMGDIIEKKKPFGTVIAAVHAVEFRPLALPRDHILLFVPSCDMFRQPCATIGDISAGIDALAMDFAPALRPSLLYLEQEMLDRVPNSTRARCISLCPSTFPTSILRHPPALRFLHGASGDVVHRYPNIFCGAPTRDSYGFKAYVRRYNRTARCGDFSFKAAKGGLLFCFVSHSLYAWCFSSPSF